MERVYYHWGDLGDTVYAMPTIRAIGPGELVLALSEKRYETLAPLLAAQPYITGVRRDPIGTLGNWAYQPQGITHDLNLFRRPEYGTLRWKTLVEIQGWPYVVGVSSAPWLSNVRGSALGSYAVVARSARYHDPETDWDAEVARLRERYGEVVFVGLPEEHRDFGRGLPYLPTANALKLAEAIQGAQHFSGNQSMPLSIAIGLGKSHSIEVDPRTPNCTFRELSYQGEVLKSA